VYEYRAEVLRWVDGDTVDLLVDLGFTVLLRARFRLLGIDTPEVNRRATREAGNAATAYARLLAPVGSLVLVRSQKAGKYGRWLGEVYPLDSEGEPILTLSVNQALVDAGHARPYG
jgi:micrococcal nuclease